MGESSSGKYTRERDQKEQEKLGTGKHTTFEVAQGPRGEQTEGAQASGRPLFVVVTQSPKEKNGSTW